MQMKIETLSTFPGCFDSVMNESIMKRAQQKGLLDFKAHDLRDWTHDAHRTTDDEPYGGGQGLVMKCEPIFEAVRAIEGMHAAIPHVVFFTPAGTRFTEKEACRLATRERILFVCGRYEGMDERVMELADECLSLGDFVLTGGELCALAVTDAVVRLVPGALGHDMSAVEESFSDDLLEHAQYTRPADFEGRTVPEVLLSGDHAAIARWKRRNAVERTARLRPDLIEKANLSEDERVLAMRIINTMTQEEA
jgi:tRNA (guanine37-N1)-methyltransferase